MANFLSGVGNFFGGLADRAKSLFSSPSRSSLTGSISSSQPIQFQSPFGPSQSPLSRLISSAPSAPQTRVPNQTRVPTLSDLLAQPAGPQTRIPTTFRPAATPTQTPAPTQTQGQVTPSRVGGQPATGGSGGTPTPPPPPQAPSGQAGISAPMFSTGGGISLGGNFVSPTGTTGAGGRAQHTGIGTAGQGTFSAVSGTPITGQTADERQEQDRQRRIVASTATAPPFQVPAVTTEAGEVTTPALTNEFSEGVSEALKTPMGSQTRSQLINQIETQIAAISEQIKQQMAVPEEPFATPEEITEDPTLQDLIKQNLQRDDELQRAAGLPTIKSQVLDLQNQINATNEAFNAIVRQVNEDPDFPKSLARRRIQEIERERGSRLSSLQNQLQTATQQYGFAVENYKNMSGIVESAEAKLEKIEERKQQQKNMERNEARANLQQFIATGALADFSPMELGSLSRTTGIDVSALRVMADAVKSGSEVKLRAAEQKLEIERQKADILQAKFDLARQGGQLGQLTPQQQSAAFSLAQDYEGASKTFFDVKGSYNRVLASGVEPSAAGDLALIFNYMKMLDPGSAVRETEFANAENAGSVPERIRAQYNKIFTGERLSTAQRTDFMDRAEKLFERALQEQQKTNQRFVERASAFGVPSNLVIRDIGQTAGREEQQISTMIKIGDQRVNAGAIIVNDKGQRGRVNPDGTITPL